MSDSSLEFGGRRRRGPHEARIGLPSASESRMWHLSSPCQGDTLHRKTTFRGRKTDLLFNINPHNPPLTWISASLLRQIANTPSPAITCRMMGRRPAIHINSHARIPDKWPVSRSCSPSAATLGGITRSLPGGRRGLADKRDVSAPPNTYLNRDWRLRPAIRKCNAPQARQIDEPSGSVIGTRIRVRPGQPQLTGSGHLYRLIGAACRVGMARAVCSAVLCGPECAPTTSGLESPVLCRYSAPTMLVSR
jgi:hypothetical protein